jgi:DNA-directed RNA polymerase III subunit RPC6
MPPPVRKRRSDDGDKKPASKKRKILVGVGLKQEDAFASAFGPSTDSLKDRFIAIFSLPQYTSGISNSALKTHFGDSEYIELAPIINDLTKESKLNMSKTGKELFYSLVSDDLASKFQGLDAAARMVYQVIEKAANMGCWTKDIRIQTNIQQNMLTKILKSLETRHLIKPVKSVAAKSKKLYMLYDIQPSKELTGGIWYSDLEFDHEFISKMRSFLLYSIRRLNSGKGVTMPELHNIMIQKKVCTVELAMEEVKQLLQTLVFDYLVEEVPDTTGEEPMFIAARRVTVPSEFTYWDDALEPDFYFRAIKFEDGVTLAPHEMHYHTA